MNEKHLIVGGGLAGICLAHRMEEAGQDFLIIDSGVNHSTSIAAGMINPMVFRKMVKTWMADTLFPELINFYSEIEIKVNEKFLFKRNIKRIFSTEYESKLWQERLNDAAYNTFVSFYDTKQPSWLDAPYGVGKVLIPGYVDSTIFLESNHRYFKAQGKLQIADFGFSKLDVTNLQYEGEKFASITFCTGYMGKTNPYFGYLPLQQTKGEVLKIKSDDFDQSEILNRKCFVLPTEEGSFRLGATFAWNTTNITPTDEAKKELTTQLAAFSKARYEIIEQKAGIRPTVTDRRPLLGQHPEINGLFIFNGLGTKGYQLAPYFSSEICQHILHGSALTQAVDIQRFFKKHYMHSS